MESIADHTGLRRLWNQVIINIISRMDDDSCLSGCTSSAIADIVDCNHTRSNHIADKRPSHGEHVKIPCVKCGLYSDIKRYPSRGIIS